MQKPVARAIAFYLPQYHPIPENDEWWGKGFTEWTNAAKAKPLFRYHYQPHIPADLGFYDLRVPEVREAQAELARGCGVEGFCYFHYWFSGRRILERPFAEVLASGKPNYPFCLCWANQTWSGIWHGAPNRILIEQTYPGMDDHRRHFEALLPAFLDERYIRVAGKPLFLIFNPNGLPDSKRVLDQWRAWALTSGLPGLYLVAEHSRADWDPVPFGYDASVNVRIPSRRRPWISWRQPIKKVWGRLEEWRGLPMVYQYADLIPHLIQAPVPGIESYPCIIPNWDNTPRSGPRGLVFHNSTPELFGDLIDCALTQLRGLPLERRLLFIKAWNEWGEGNHLEPDLRFGHGYLNVLREKIIE